MFGASSSLCASCRLLWRNGFLLVLVTVVTVVRHCAFLRAKERGKDGEQVPHKRMKSQHGVPDDLG